MNKLFWGIFRRKTKEIFDFNANNPLGMDGERVDFLYNEKFDYSLLDIYQKNHFRRYEFAVSRISDGEICGDFACGTGYGSAMISKVADKVIGADINGKVIRTIRKRYKNLTNLNFIHRDLLNLNFENHFTSIVSFETIEHFSEPNIIKLLNSFNQSLVTGGRIIVSTPYMQEDSEAARELGFHRTFYIDENKIRMWLIKTGFGDPEFSYQDYKDHQIKAEKGEPDFLIFLSNKIG